MSNVNYLLVAVLAALLIGVIKGYKNGFLRIAVSFAGLICVILIVTKISPYVRDYLINNTDSYQKVRQKIVEVYNEKNAVSDDDEDSETDQDKVIRGFGLPDILSEALVSNNNEDTYKKLAAVLFEEYISGYLAKIVISAGSFVGLFVLLAIVMFCLLAAIKLIDKIPVLRTFNRLLGVAAGAGMVVIFIWVFFIAITVIFYDSLGSKLFGYIQSSTLLSYLYNNNVLLKLLL